MMSCSLGILLAQVTILLHALSAFANFEGNGTHSECLSLSGTKRITVELSHHRQVELIRKSDLTYLNSYLRLHAVKDITVSIYCSNSTIPFKLNLKSSPLILFKELKVTYFDRNNRTKHRYMNAGNLSMFYAGYGADAHGLSHFHLHNGNLEADISLSSIFSITTNIDHDGLLTFTLSSKSARPPTRCGNRNHDKPSDNSPHIRVRRMPEPVHPPARSNFSTRYIEMYIVVDHKLYNRSGSSLLNTVERVVKILNYASSLYRKMNIYLALIGIEVWSEGDRLLVTANPNNIDNVLGAFDKYRRTEINPQYPNDNAQLFVGYSFDSGIIGKASWSMCSHTGGVAVSVDHKEKDWVISATTMAHELGHNLGLPHDDQSPYLEGDCTCTKNGRGSDQCIMYSSSVSDTQPTDWSQCSVDKIKESFATKGTDYCLLNLPDALRHKPSCGNYFVDEGEECDCGPAEECDNKCCQPLTCELARGAQCATGTCCDKEECVWMPAATECRPASNKHCDLEEYCDGTSEWCPADTHKLDGYPCTALSAALCYGGVCRSRDLQCEFVWGDGVRSSVTECYTYWNLFGKYFGHCGYNVSEVDSTPLTTPRRPIRLDYWKCTIENAQCGMLHCDTNKTKGVLGLRSYVDYIESFKTVDGEKKRCHVVTFDVGLEQDDPGLVPEGSVCGDNKWCRSQHCVDTPSLPDHCNCSGNGVCNQHLHCHCSSLFDPHTNCSTIGPGGSLESGPARVYTLPTTAGVHTAPTPMRTAAFVHTTEAPAANWVMPLSVSIGLIGAAAIAVATTAAVIKRHKISQYFEQRKLDNRSSFAKDFAGVPNADRDVKISGAPSDVSTNRSNASKFQDLISNPILESTTINNSIVLYDIPKPKVQPTPHTNVMSPRPVTNPIYYSEFDEMCDTPHADVIPLRLADISRCPDSAYSECRISDDSETDSEDAHPYEDIPPTNIVI